MLGFSLRSNTNPRYYESELEIGVFTFLHTSAKRLDPRDPGDIQIACIMLIRTKCRSSNVSGDV
jgi:hypothetical protein